MASSVFPGTVTGVTVETATDGALSGDGSSGNKLAVQVDGDTITVNGSNQLVASGGGGFDPAADIAFTGADSFAGHPLTVDSLVTTGFTLPSYQGGQVVPSVDADGVYADASVLAPPTIANGNPNIAPVLAGAGAGNLSNGVYHYKFTFTTGGSYTGVPGETTGSVASDAVTVVDKTANGKVKIPDIGEGDVIFAGVSSGDITGVNIYRSEVDGTTTYRLVGAYADADFVDNLSNASWASAALLPTTNTAQTVNPMLNVPNVWRGPSTLLQENVEIISFGIPTSKLAGGVSLNVQIPGWQSAGSGGTYQGVSMVLGGGSYVGDGTITFTSAVWSIDAAGVLQTSGYKSSDGSAGVSGSFTSQDGKTVTVKNGLITAIA